VMFEMAGPAEELAKEAMRLAIFKLPIKCKFMTKRDFEAMPAVAIEETEEEAVAAAE
jgi:ribosomal protein L16/L10AE